MAVLDVDKLVGKTAAAITDPEERSFSGWWDSLGSKSVGDVTDAMASADKQNLAIIIQHIPSGQKVRFKALLKEFSDKFESQWSSEVVYGRMDPIETFQGTKRIITLSWDVVAFSLAEAEKNLLNADKLANFLYPVYGTTGGATTIKSSPLLRVKLANLIRVPGPAGEGKSVESGLVVRMTGFSYTPDFDSGVHMKGKANCKLYPQTIHISTTLHVLHTHQLGWKEGKQVEVRHAGFPHGPVTKAMPPPEASSDAAAPPAALAAPVTSINPTVAIDAKRAVLVPATRPYDASSVDDLLDAPHVSPMPSTFDAFMAADDDDF
jgi:hypothetical protein